METDLHRMDAKCFDGFIQDNHGAVDLAAFRVDRIGHITTGHRTVELPGVTRLTDHDVGGSVQTFAGLGRAGLGRGVAGFYLRALRFEHLHICRGGAKSLGPRQEIISCETVLYRHSLT